MSNFEDRVREVVDPLIKDVERMFYDGYQAPDLRPIHRSLDVIKRYVEDIKFELDPVNRDILSRPKKDSDEEDDHREDPSHDVEDSYPYDQRLLEDARSLAEQFYDALQTQGPTGAKEFLKSLLFNDDGSINPAGFPALAELFATANSPEAISSLLQHYGVPKWISDTLGSMISDFLEGWAFKSAVKSIVPVSVAGPSSFQIGKQITSGFSDTMDSLDSALSTIQGELDRIQQYQDDVVKPYLQTIFDKIIECCSKQVLEEINQRVIDLGDQSSEINFKISSLQPTTNLNNTLNVVTSNKSILAKLRDIRSLL